jgi:putative hydrolase of the HAD superfamily
MGAVLRAVLFDAVGTLMRPYPSVGSVYSRAAAACGIRCSPGILESEFRTAYRELMPRRFSGADFGTSESREQRWWKAAVARTFERAGCTPVPPKVTESAFSAFASGHAWRLYADVLPLFEKLKGSGVRLGVVSNFDSRLRKVIADLGLCRYGLKLVISSEVRSAKPSPRIYRIALDALGTEPGEALFVGDRKKQDYDGPRAAGLEALWLVRDGRRRGEKIIRSLRSVAGRVKPLAP